MALAFLILAGVVHLGLVRFFDRQLLDALQSVANATLDMVGSLTTVAGQAEVMAGIALGLVIARLRARRADFWVPLAIALVVLIEAIGKILVAQPSPAHELSRGFAVLPGIQDPFGNSFPSGHVARDAFLLFVINGWPRLLTAVALVLVGLTRVYLGEHWPSDVVGGLALGAAVAWVVLAVARSRSRSSQNAL